MQSVAVMASFLFFLLLSVVCYSHSFLDLPEDVTAHKIFGGLSIFDKVKSILPISKAGQSHFELYHYEQTTLCTQLLSALITFKSANSASVKKIENITKQLQFSEMLPCTMPTICKLISRVPKSTDRSQIMIAMNLHSISVSELRLLQKMPISEGLDILIFASRALLNYYIPNVPVPYNPATVLEAIQLPGFAETAPFPWFSEDYPWIVHYFDADVISSHQYWAIYMSYLYEVTFDLSYKSANISSLNCAFKNFKICDEDDHQNRKNLRDLMEFGLILWSRENINDLRSKFFTENQGKYPFSLFVLEAFRMNQLLFGDRRQMLVDSLPVMTKFVLDLANKYDVNLYANKSKTFEIRPLTQTLAMIEECRFGNYVTGQHQAFADLTRLILRIGDINYNKMLIIGCLAQNEVNKGYIEATIQIMCDHDSSMQNINIKKFLIHVIIHRSKVHFFETEDKERSLSEIRKLAKDPLFAAGTISILAQEANEEYVHAMMTELFKQRTDWSFKPSQQKPPA